MAESVGLFFGDATQREVAATMDMMGRRIDPAADGSTQAWAYPVDAAATLLVYPYDDPSLLNELEDTQIDGLIAALGVWPSTCWAIELGGGHGRRKVDDAVGLTLRLLRAHHGVAQDDHALDGAGEFLTRTAIEAGVRGERPAFLDGLRSRLLW